MTPRQRTMRDVEAVARIHDVPLAAIFSERRDRKAARARQAVMWMLRFSKGWSYPAIGKFLNRDHTSVTFGVGRHEMRLGKVTPVAEYAQAKRQKARAWYYSNRATRRMGRMAA